MRNNPLVGVDAVAERIGSADAPTLLDVRWQLGDPHGHADHLLGHLPGAVYVDLERDLSGPAGQGGRHPLPDAETFAAAMRRCGVSGDRPVVVYDARTSMAAARCWWLLRYFGHHDVQVLDGGYAAWVADGRPVEQGEAPPRPGDFTPVAGGMPVLGVDELLRFTRRGVLLDVRAPERFRGEQEPVDPVAGHIPGATNLPTTGNVTDDGRFLPVAALQDRLAHQGIAPGDEVGTYCGSGVTAAHTVLALERAGVEAALYPGSWSEWISDPSRPVATGQEPPRRLDA